MKNIIIPAFILFFVISSFVYLEIEESRNSLQKILKNEASTLIHSLNLSFRNTFYNSEEIEKQVNSRLFLASNVISKLITQKTLNQKFFSEIAEKYSLDYILITDYNGLVLKSNDSNITSINLSEINPELISYDTSYNLGIKKDINSGKEMYLVGRLGKDVKGFIIVGLKAEKILEYRQRTGIGKQISEISENEEIIYIALQDEEGILSASKNIRELSSLNSDSILNTAYINNLTTSRMIDFQKTKVFEIFKTISFHDGYKLITRIGISTENIRNIQKQNVLRIISIGSGIFLSFIILTLLYFIRRDYTKLKKEHKKILNYNDLVLENISDGIISLNSEGKILLINKSGVEILEIEHTDFLDHYYNEIIKNDELYLNKLIGNSSFVFNLETAMIINGKKKIIDLSTKIITGSDNQNIYTALFRDITNKKYLEFKLKTNEKLTAMGELAAGVAHEIRNPLNAINIITQRFESEFTPNEDKEEYKNLIKIIRTEIRRVNEIIKQFLEFAKPPAFNPKECNISQLISDSIDFIKSSVQNTDIQFNTDIEQSIIVKIDSNKIRQVLINLFINAIDAMPNGGILFVRTEQILNNFRIIIKDTGNGIDEENLNKIFNLYFSTKNNGTGIGLSLAYQIISEHNGNIFVESKINEGTTFIIELPLI